MKSPDERFKASLNKINLGGVKHVLQGSVWVEKLFWLTVLFCGLAASSLLVRKQINSWYEDPVTRSIEQRKVSDYPFPAVTLCHPGFARFDFVAKYLNHMELEEVDTRFKEVKTRFMKQVVHEHGIYTQSPIQLYHDYEKDCLTYRRRMHNLSCSLTEWVVLAQKRRNSSFEDMTEEFATILVQADEGKYNVMREFVNQLQKDAQAYLDRNNTTVNNIDLLPEPPEENWSTLYHIAWIRVAAFTYGFSPKLGLVKGADEEEFNSLLNMKTQRPGSLYSKLYSVYTKNSFYRVPDDWELAESYYGNFTQSFKLPGIQLSPIDIIPLLMTISMETLSKDRFELDWSNSWTLEHQAQRFLATFPSNGYPCIEEMRMKYPHGNDYHEPSPCHNGKLLNKHCQSWCELFRELDQVLDRKVLLGLMKSAIVQNAVVPFNPPIDSEIVEHVYKQMFPNSTYLNGNGTKLNFSAETPMFIYCKDRFREKWKGANIGFGLINQFCQDFFTSPTDLGFCSTKNWRADTNLKRQKSTMPFLENFDSFPGPLQYSHSNIREGVVTLVIDSQIRHTIPRTSSMDKDKDDILNNIQLQLHQVDSVGQMITSQDFSRDMEVLTLKSGQEYFIEITAHGNDVTNRFKDSLSPEYHPCHLDVSSHNLALFQTYSHSNCYYECRVKYAANICGCVPWDYLSNLNSPLCDVFGTTCFRNMMQNATFMTDLPCSCPRACTEILYSKRLERVTELDGPVNEWYPRFFGCGRLCEYLANANGTIRDPSLLDVSRYYDFSGNQVDTELDVGEKAFRDIIVVHLQFHSPKIEFTILDARATWIEKLAEFGGTFGLLTQITGLSILSLIQFLALSGKTLWQTLFHKI